MTGKSERSPQFLYRIYSTLIEAVAEYARSNDFKPILPSTSAPAPEFAETLPFPLDDDWGVLPQSHSFHKQLAAECLGRVYCIGPAYRRTDEDHLHSAVFHQIEFEVAGGTFDEARDVALDLLQVLIGAVAGELECTTAWPLSPVDEVDLAAEEKAPTYAQYDSWVEGIVAKLERPLWALNTPKTPPPILNKTSGPYSKGFDLLTPLPSGELLSGGEREPGQAAAFLGVPVADGSSDARSSGFGIGLERLAMALSGSTPIRTVMYPHGGPWTSKS